MMLGVLAIEQGRPARIVHHDHRLRTSREHSLFAGKNACLRNPRLTRGMLGVTSHFSRVAATPFSAVTNRPSGNTATAMGLQQPWKSATSGPFSPNDFTTSP